MGRERIRGDVQSDTPRGSRRNDYRYENVSKAGMKKSEAAYNVNTTKTNAPIRTIAPARMTTTKNLAIPANAGMTRFVAGMARFVCYVGGCRPGDDSHRLIWEAVFS